MSLLPQHRDRAKAEDCLTEGAIPVRMFLYNFTPLFCLSMIWSPPIWYLSLGLFRSDVASSPVLFGQACVQDAVFMINAFAMSRLLIINQHLSYKFACP